MILPFPITARGSGPTGFGGWLLVVAAGLAYRVLSVPLVLVTSWGPWLLDQAGREVLADPTAYGYHPSFPAFVLFYLLVTVLIGFAAAVGLVLFARRSPEFPKYMIAYYLGSFVLLFTVLTVELSMWPDTGDPSSHSGTSANLAAAFLWMALGGPYMLLSRRVKNTFSKLAPPAATNPDGSNAPR